MKIHHRRRGKAIRKARQVAALQGVPLEQNTLMQARSMHRAGRFSEAESLYMKILSTEPDNPEALHFLGILAHQVGKGEIGVELIRKALKCRPDYANAHNNLGIILHDLGKLEEALISYQHALTLKPDFAEVYRNMGYALKDQGKLDEAVACFRQALALRPDFIEVANNLGVTLKDQGKLEEAVACFRQALSLKPDDADALYNLGNTLGDQGKLDEAVSCYRQALALKPDDADVHFNLGNTLKDQGKAGEAAACFRRATGLQPDYAEAYNNLGGILSDQGKLDEATACFRQAISSRPDYAEAHNNLGGVLSDLDKLDEAIACFRQAITLKPDYTDALNNLGLLFSQLGKMDDAIDCFKKALYQKTNNTRAYKGLSAIVKSTEADEVVQSMESLFKNKGEIADADRAELGFVLGKVFEDLKEYDKAFSVIFEANCLKRGSFEYSIRNDYDFFERIKKTFSSDFFGARRDSGNQEGTPIFILGMPRSGTTLVEQILASHPLVFGAGEVTILINLTNDICTGEATAAYPECMSDLGRDVFVRMGSDYLRKIREYSRDAKFITDKMPHNFLRVGLIKTILPNAKVIHCVRDPMDTCFSIYKRDFTRMHKYAYDMAELGRYYNLYRDLMAHWEKVLPGFMYTLRYEELVTGQQTQTKSLLDFCGLPWDDACLSFFKKERKVNTASLAQVRQPIYRDSVELWKRYEKHLEPLRRAIFGH